jgi:Sulfotransferase family
MAIKPIFVFSISRSGSTLLQRIIAAHDGVATVSEPWLLLPMGYTLRPRGVHAEYVHGLMVDAIEDFCKELPAGRADYLAELRGAALRLYEKAAPSGARYFVDKSPPYCLIAEEIMQLFPDGKFVFLWRNPLSVLASMIDTWGPWHPTLLSNELFVGLPRLLAAFQVHRARAHAVRFEDLVGGEEQSWRALMRYLEIDFEPAALRDFSQVKLNGRMGDPTGVKRYSALSAEPSQKWRSTLANPLRREWSRRYIRFLGRERLALMGYESRELLAELDRAPAGAGSLLGDVGRLIADVAKEPVRVRTRGRWIGEPPVIRELLRS